MNVFCYLLEANIYLLIFWGVYKLLFKNETFFSLNRLYLLITSLLAFVLPLVQLSGLRPVSIEPQLIYTFEVLPMAHTKNMTSFWTPLIICYIIYLSAVLVLLARFGLKLYQIIQLIHKNEAEKYKGFKKIYLPRSGLAFSFLDYLFIDTELPSQKTIILHEQVHIRHFHTLDVLFFELLRIICWFNPVLKYLNKEIKVLHEFIADEETLKYEIDAEHYSLFLIGNSSGFLELALGSEMFRSSLLKKRITKLFQRRSSQTAKWKYLVFVPLLLIMPCISSVVFVKEYGLIDLFSSQQIVSQSLNFSTFENRSRDDHKDTSQQKLQKTNTTVNHPIAEKHLSGSFGRQGKDTAMLKTLGNQIWINATTDTVKITTIPAAEGRNAFKGIYVIEDKIYTERELRKAMEPTGELVVILPNRPMLGMFTEKDDRAIKRWGDKAGEGVIFVKSKKDTASIN